VDGHPAIAWEGSENYGVSYTRALDADGASWGTAQELIQMIGPPPSNCAMIEANGKPAICYWDDWGHYLCWIRADDAAGDLWDLPLTIQAFSANYTQRLSLAIISGSPAVCYAYQENEMDGLMYRRALDPGGNAWGEPVWAAICSEYGVWPTLVTVNGRPAISYVEYLEEKYTHTLMYVTAADAEGNGWRSPVVVEGPPVGKGGPTYSSLAEVSGHPAISYQYRIPEQGDYDYELRFAIYY